MYNGTKFSPFPLLNNNVLCKYSFFNLSIYLFIFVVLGIKLRVSRMGGKRPTRANPHPFSCFEGPELFSKLFFFLVNL
jgi:hypothetical protein